LLLFLTPQAEAEPFVPGHALDQELVQQVTATALAFMAPRTLDPAPVWQLAMWGLSGLTTLDSQLSSRLDDNELRLTAGSRLIAVRTPPPDDPGAWAEATAQLVRAAWDTSEQVRKAGTEGIIQAFFDELFNHLDPYSRYAPPAEAAADRIRRAGRAGIGITVEQTRRGAQVQSIAADGPAANAGIRRGDVIVEIDGQATADLDLDTISGLLAGPENTWLALSLRERAGRVRTLTLERVRVPPETVQPVRVEGVLLLRISGFASDTGARLAHEIVRGTTGPRPPRGVVLDLRGNRGGLLSQAASAAETLVPDGMLATTAGRDPAAAHEFRANGVDLARGLPIIVMVDGRSASAAEIMAAALADRGRAVVVGSSTLGKGLVQTITPLPDGGELFITWSRVLAPLGWPLQGLGVLPQVCTSLGQDSVERQLAALAEGQSLMDRAIWRHRNARAPLPAAEMLEIRNACPAAEGRDLDLAAARALIDRPAAYAAALLATH
jgi:carboxyl-terminal processing protease